MTVKGVVLVDNQDYGSALIVYSGKRLSEIQTKLCLAWFIARDTVPHTTAHRYKASLWF